jgi:hypothetical protein
MDDFGEKKPFSIYFLFFWGESAGRQSGERFPDHSRFSWAKT